MSKITIEGMEFYAHHGCFVEERKVGTWFQVDLEMTVDTANAEKSDNLDETVNYAEVYLTVKREMNIPSKLLENVAYRIKTAVLKEYPSVEQVRVKVRKLNPPLGGKMKSVSVEI
ncbi:MAG: dihydroneopterin aldolase [Bacteroidales bacterium]|nr:dihydroneopterin aldolase [Bacteroidales bacterium]